MYRINGSNFVPFTEYVEMLKEVRPHTIDRQYLFSFFNTSISHQILIILTSHLAIRQAYEKRFHMYIKRNRFIFLPLSFKWPVHEWLQLESYFYEKFPRRHSLSILRAKTFCKLSMKCSALLHLLRPLRFYSKQ